MEYKNLKRVVSIGAEFGEALEQFLLAESGLKKAYAVIGVFDDVQALFDIDVRALRDEYDALDREGTLAIIEQFKQDFDLENDVIEIFVEESMNAALKLVDFIDSCMEIYKKYKKKEP